MRSISRRSIGGHIVTIPLQLHAALRSVPFLLALSSFLLFSFLLPPSSFAETYYTHPLTPDVKTLRVITDGDFQKLPVIDNTENSSLEISFDLLADEQTYLQYRVVHCDAQWQIDDLSELDYIDGFQPTRLTDVQPSFNTFVNYWHYRLSFPNEEVRLLVSGNYAVIFHLEDDPDEVVAVACFSITEQMAFVSGEVSGNTDIDYRMEHQQLTLQCTWSQQLLPYLNAANDLHMVVTQNHRPDTRRDILHPSRLEAGKAWYEHLRPLIFEAGNTYRRFEFIDRHYATLGVEQVRYDAPYYYVSLPMQSSRQGGFYRYDQDQHGRYVVHALRVDDEALECEYFWATFRLSDAMPSHHQSIYLSGDFTYGELTDEYRMIYDPDEQCYIGRVLLKQGHYNYQFICGPEWVPDYDAGSLDGNRPSTTLSVCEGNYYESHNEYDIYIYYRAPGERYDRLLGVAQL